MSMKAVITEADDLDSLRRSQLNVIVCLQQTLVFVGTLKINTQNWTLSCKKSIRISMS